MHWKLCAPRAALENIKVSFLTHGWEYIDQISPTSDTYFGYACRVIGRNGLSRSGQGIGSTMHPQADGCMHVSGQSPTPVPRVCELFAHGTQQPVSRVAMFCIKRRQ